MSNDGVFYITGRGGSLNRGLGAYLSERYGLLGGIGLSHTWLRKPHEDQVALVLKCLKEAEVTRAPVIANSYGSYLVMLALLDSPPLASSAMLVSPVLGKAVIRGTYFSPAGSKRLAAALDGHIEKPSRLELYIGETDPHYAPATWRKLCVAIKPDKQQVFAGEGHSLSEHLVSGLVRDFMQRHDEIAKS